jgi:hypothetical protein
MLFRDTHPISGTFSAHKWRITSERETKDFSNVLHLHSITQMVYAIGFDLEYAIGGDRPHPGKSFESRGDTVHVAFPQILW